MAIEEVNDSKELLALRRAVAKALDRKRRLGQYAVVWRDGRVVRLEPEELGSYLGYSMEPTGSASSVRESGTGADSSDEMSQ